MFQLLFLDFRVLMKKVFTFIFCLFGFGCLFAQNDLAVHDTIVKSYYKSGELQAECPYLQGKPNGIAKWYFKSGLVSKEVEYSERDELNYCSFEYYKNGKLRSKFSRPQRTSKENSDYFTGYYIWYYQNGNIEKEGFSLLNNGLSGLWKYYYENGKLKKEGVWTNFIKTGIWKFYNVNGSLIKQKNYN